jgi:hypothetical protein
MRQRSQTPHSQAISLAKANGGIMKNYFDPEAERLFVKPNFAPMQDKQPDDYAEVATKMFLEIMKLLEGRDPLAVMDATINVACAAVNHVSGSSGLLGHVLGHRIMQLMTNHVAAYKASRAVFGGQLSAADMAKTANANSESMAKAAGPAVNSAVPTPASEPDAEITLDELLSQVEKELDATGENVEFSGGYEDINPEDYDA